MTLATMRAAGSIACERLECRAVSLSMTVAIVADSAAETHKVRSDAS